MTTHTIHAIIPAGGSGTRLWPLSRRDRPKFLLDLTGNGRSMLQSTVERLAPIARSITVVTGTRHYDAVAEQLSQVDTPCSILAEPAPRNSMAAIGWAAYTVRQHYGDDAIIGSFAADHAIAHPGALHHAIEQAARAAEEGYLTTIGIAPTSPSTAYGYIHPGAPITHAPGALAVTEFVEKPDQPTAEQYVKDGFVWNAGIFIVRAGTLRDALANEKPDMDRTLNSIVQAGKAQKDVWESLESVAIDYALAEPLAAAGRVAVVPARELGWTDVGDFASLNELTDAADEKSVIRIKSPRTRVYSSTEQTVALVGLEGITVVVQDDAILVVNNDQAQDVSHVVRMAAERGRRDMI